MDPFLSEMLLQNPMWAGTPQTVEPEGTRGWETLIVPSQATTVTGLKYHITACVVSLKSFSLQHHVYCLCLHLFFYQHKKKNDKRPLKPPLSLLLSLQPLLVDAGLCYFPVSLGYHFPFRSSLCSHTELRCKQANETKRINTLNKSK